MKILERPCFFVMLLVGFCAVLQPGLSWSEGPALSAHTYRSGRHVTFEDMPTIDFPQLPQEAKDTLSLIKQGGPFPYRKDGTIFRNRERRLPIRHRDYYKEYTVKTPGIRTRGPRRIIAGTDGDYYYTDDHYNTFKKIRGALP
jgi:ribonuclease T1